MTEPVRVQEADFSLAEEVAAVRAVSRRIGGIATFLGCAREVSDGREVAAIRFEQYGAMATKAMRALRDEALARFAIIEARIVHRVARVGPGEQIVLIVVGAEHRGPAFDACRWLIDELKRRVPIWKREETPEGEHWVTPHP